MVAHTDRDQNEIPGRVRNRSSRGELFRSARTPGSVRRRCSGWNSTNYLAPDREWPKALFAAIASAACPVFPVERHDGGDGIIWIMAALFVLFESGRCAVWKRVCSACLHTR